MIQKRLVLAVASLALLFAARSSQAALGEPAGTVKDDVEKLGATDLSMTECERYTVHRMDVGGTTFKEYVSSAGVVFALTWNGLARPDLEKVLGTYAEEYRKLRSGAAKKGGPRHRKLSSEHLVLEEWGHMRALRGRVFAPALLPEGVSRDELQ